MLGHPNIYIKDERQGPTNSFKDRQAAVAVSAMQEAGVKEAVVASTGNVAIAYSAYCARAGIKLWAFVTNSVPAEKVREIAIYGSEVIIVASTYDDAKKIAADFSHDKGFFLDRGIKSVAAKEAMKTVAFEIAEQLGTLRAGGDSSMPNGNRHPWQTPNWFIQAVSGGMGPVGVMKGFQELNELGLITKMPKLACIQVAGCAPMANSFKKGLEVAENVEEPETDIATLATGFPGEAYQVLRSLILEHGGTMESVTDQEAFNALRLVAKMDGISVEPATAVAFAGLVKLIHAGVIRPHETVVVNCSGHTFPVEKHIVGEHQMRNMILNDAAVHKLDLNHTSDVVTSHEEIDRRQKHVVIVEDNEDSLKLIRRILQSHSELRIDEAADGTIGLEKIKTIQPDLVLLDLTMPGLDGFSIVEAMKGDKNLKDIPIIVITARDLSLIERKRLDGKIKTLLQKGSFMITDLVEGIQQALL
jgi:threonine synthase